MRSSLRSIAALASLGALYAGMKSEVVKAGEAIQSFGATLRDLSTAQQSNVRYRNRMGRGVRRLPRGRPGHVALYHSPEAAQRAVRRGERWMRANPNATFRDDAPGHIVRNYRHAQIQLGAKS